MINLLPKSALKIVRREYGVRILVIALLVATFNLFAFALLTLPTDFLIQSLQKNISSNLEDAMATEKSYLALRAKVSETNSLIALLSERSDVRCTDLMSTLDEFSGNDVFISEFAFGKQDGVVVLTGVANSRASLSGFRNTLESSDIFSSADLPLSNLAKDSDIPFTMTVTMSNTPK